MFLSVLTTQELKCIQEIFFEFKQPDVVSCCVKELMRNKFVNPVQKQVSKNNCFELFATEPLWGCLRTSFWEDQVCHSSKRKKFRVGNFKKC